MSRRILRGIGVSAGVGRGMAFVMACGDRSAVPRHAIAAAEVDRERARLDAALARADAELAVLQRDVADRIGRREGDVFGAQRLVVADPVLREQVLDTIGGERVNAEAALARVVDTYTRSLDAVADGYLRERASDVRDVGHRVLSALADEEADDGPELPDGAVVVVDELLPSATARLDLRRLAALVTERGSRFSHSAILARSMGIAAVAGVPDASRAVRTGEPVIVDGVSGAVFVDPDPTVEGEYARAAEDLRRAREELTAVAGLPAVTLDGTGVALLANVNKLADADAALPYAPDGVGLYRTEFAFSVRDAFPTEDEQYALFSGAAARFHPRRVVFRLVDLGGDKLLPYFPLPPSRNPSLSQRGTRLLLRHPEVLRPQLRALLRIGAEHPIGILLPMVGGLEEVRAARAAVREAQAELAAEGRPFDPRVPVGAMIEVPSAALVAGALAREVDFLSLGTNDLVQYVLAADREDETVAGYYAPLHPAVLRLVDAAVEGARAAGRELTICGEMAGEAANVELLLGLGLRRLSVAPGELLDVKAAIRRTRLDEARALAREALSRGSVAEVEALLARRGAASR